MHGILHLQPASSAEEKLVTEQLENILCSTTSWIIKQWQGSPPWGKEGSKELQGGVVLEPRQEGTCCIM